VSQLSLNQWSIGDGRFPLEALKQLLSLNNLSGELVAESQIRGITSAVCKRVTRFVGAPEDPWNGYRQGYQVSIALDESQFRDGSRMLFCSVLHRFLSLYAGVNTFVELSLDDGAAGHQVWAPLSSKTISL
jgi:type VI protein secretion system component VasA